MEWKWMRFCLRFEVAAKSNDSQNLLKPPSVTTNTSLLRTLSDFQKFPLNLGTCQKFWKLPTRKSCNWTPPHERPTASQKIRKSKKEKNNCQKFEITVFTRNCHFILGPAHSIRTIFSSKKFPQTLALSSIPYNELPFSRDPLKLVLTSFDYISITYVLPT